MMSFVDCGKRSIVTMLLLGSLFLGCSGEKKEDTDEHDVGHAAESTESVVVHLDNHKVFHAGIKTALVAKMSVAVPLSLSGKVSFNEQRTADITARVGGRIERVNVFTNDRVNEHSPLVLLYSQEFLTMQNEFLQASNRWNGARGAQSEDKTAIKAIYESAKRKLLIIGVDENEVSELETSRTLIPFYSVRSPFAGTILESKIRQGAFVQLGSELFEIADLSTVWVLADIYEKDLPLVHVGMKAQVEVAASPNSFPGVVSTIYSVLDEKTRTVKARVVVENQSGKLKPEMYCNALIQTQFDKETIKVPAGALLGDTEKHFVFIATTDTTFEKRDIRTGVETRDFVEVLDGLIVGERLVVKGGFFLKSELAKETFGEEH